jgi:hypothetical protein
VHLLVTILEKQRDADNEQRRQEINEEKAPDENYETIDKHFNLEFKRIED